jgi:hypothetical protein
MDAIMLDPAPMGFRKEFAGAEGSQELIARLAKKIAEMRLSTPAIFFLESMKPLSFLGSQALVFLQPIVTAFFNPKEYTQLTEMLEDRKNVEKLICEIERVDAEVESARKQAKEAKKQQKT